MRENQISDGVDSVPSDAPASPAAEGGGRERSERLRAKRDADGLAQVAGWVPKERRAYAREVLAALARGANSLPPDPEQAAALDAVRAEAEVARAGEAAARAELAEAEERAQAANQRAEAAERSREETAGKLAMVKAEAETIQGREKAAQEAADVLRGELAGIKGRGGWRGVLLRLAGA